jgi:hypothetical protein
MVGTLGAVDPDPIEADGLVPARREAVFAFLVDLAKAQTVAARQALSAIPASGRAARA